LREQSVKHLLVLLSGLTLVACKQEPISQNKQSPQETQVEKPKDNINQLTVTVEYLKLEGGFYGLVTQNGEKLLPMNLSKEYRHAGTVLKVTGKKLTDVMTIQQWGTPFELTTVELIKKGESNQK